MYKQKAAFKILVAIITSVLLLSCNSSKKINSDFNYFQNGLDSIKSKAFIEPKLKINDQIKIQVIAGSLRQEDAALFNLISGSASQSGNSAQPGNASQPGNPTQSGGANYTIDNLGNIEMPKIGKIKAADIDIKQLADTIRLLLINEVKNPLVIVSKIVKLKINILGEVKKPGAINFAKDNVNIIDAIAEAGDLTDNGKREDILLMRKVDDKYETYKLDLRSTSFINSPAFYLQDNDVVYVGANKAKLLTVGKDPNSDRKFQMTLQVLSSAAVILNAIAILKRL